jgi:hypothetical protein
MTMAFSPEVNVLGRKELLLVAEPEVIKGMLPTAAMKLGWLVDPWYAKIWSPSLLIPLRAPAALPPPTTEVVLPEVWVMVTTLPTGKPALGAV